MCSGARIRDRATDSRSKRRPADPCNITEQTAALWLPVIRRPALDISSRAGFMHASPINSTRHNRGFRNTWKRQQSRRKPIRKSLACRDEEDRLSSHSGVGLPRRNRRLARPQTRSSSPSIWPLLSKSWVRTTRTFESFARQLASPFPLLAAVGAKTAQ